VLVPVVFHQHSGCLCQRVRSLTLLVFVHVQVNVLRTYVSLIPSRLIGTSSRSSVDTLYQERPPFLLALNTLLAHCA
jgi:hypothetical protein